jgi:predicted glycoside hydrolase/deacetylase ChbG (UPF0249 family)
LCIGMTTDSSGAAAGAAGSSSDRGLRSRFVIFVIRVYMTPDRRRCHHIDLPLRAAGRKDAQQMRESMPADPDGTDDAGGPDRQAPAGQPTYPVVLCADDYGLSEAVSEGIIRLAEQGRLSAVSCMTWSPLWPSLAGRLDRMAAGCEAGLHLTLTDQQPLGRMPQLAPAGRLPGRDRLMAAAFAGRLDAAEVRAEVRRQWQAFASARGTLPAFVDGHQHVHLLPTVRTAVLDLLAEIEPARRPWLRLCWEAPERVLARRVAAGKAMLLAALSMPLRRRARRAPRSSRVFSGGGPRGR